MDRFHNSIKWTTYWAFANFVRWEKPWKIRNTLWTWIEWIWDIALSIPKLPVWLIQKPISWVNKKTWWIKKDSLAKYKFYSNPILSPNILSWPAANDDNFWENWKVVDIKSVTKPEVPKVEPKAELPKVA